MRAIEINDSAALDAFFASFANRPVTLLLGSGISQFAPSGLPTGEALSAQLARMLSDGVGKTAKDVCSLVKRAAFEHIMEACPYKEALCPVIARQFRRDVPNEVHLRIGDLVKAGRVQHIITTNYDLCLETALQGSGIQNVVTEDDARAVDRMRSVYFKIHGCASLPESLVFTLRGEKPMDPWKAALLRDLVPVGLLVIGYSGKDFEICPELAKAGVPIGWNCFYPPVPAKYEPSASAIRVLQLPTSAALIGDMCKLIEGFNVRMPTVVRDPGTPIPDDDFLAGASDREKARNLDYWRCELFRGIGSADAAVTTARRLLADAADDEEKSHALHCLGLGLFHRGKYRSAARAYRRAANLRTGPERLPALFDLVEALRCAGKSAAAKEMLKGLEAECQGPQYLPPILVRQLLLIVTRVELLRSTWREAMADALANEGEQLAARLAAAAEEQGAHFESAQCSDLRRRLRRVAAPAATGLLTGTDRYHQLGYVVAKASGLRKDLLEGVFEGSDSNAIEIWDELHRVGAAAEAWKFGLVCLLVLDSKSRLRSGAKILQDNIACQYTLQQRVVLIAQILVEHTRIRRQHSATRP